MGKIDENYEGSIFELLGLDRELCDDCGSHLKNGICLNACHLRVGTLRRFLARVREAKTDAAAPAADGGR